MNNSRLIDVDMQLGHIHHLMQMYVLGTGDFADSFGDFRCEGQVVLAIQTGNLHVDRGWQTEVQYLTHDISRLKIEKGSWPATIYLVPYFEILITGKGVEKGFLLSLNTVYTNLSLLE